MKRSGEQGQEKSAKRTFEYRGRTIEIIPDARRPAIRIDGEEIAYEQTDEGVYSHEMAHVLFGSPDELARALVRDWGAAKIERRPRDHH